MLRLPPREDAPLSPLPGHPPEDAALPSPGAAGGCCTSLLRYSPEDAALPSPGPPGGSCTSPPPAPPGGCCTPLLERQNGTCCPLPSAQPIIAGHQKTPGTSLGTVQPHPASGMARGMAAYGLPGFSFHFLLKNEPNPQGPALLVLFAKARCQSCCLKQFSATQKMGSENRFGARQEPFWMGTNPLAQRQPCTGCV